MRLINGDLLPDGCQQLLAEVEGRKLVIVKISKSILSGISSNQVEHP